MTTRRQFLERSVLVTGGAALSLTALGRLSARSARASSGQTLRGQGYGTLIEMKPSNADHIREARFPELADFPILALPRGFEYRAFSFVGGTLSDGHPVPHNHDGMAAFRHPTRRGVVRLIRNQEDRAAPGQGSVLGPIATKYDPLGGGGNVTLDYDERRQRLVQDYLSLNGTIVNCAGGIGYGFGAWLTCEETVEGPPSWGQPHGYVFEVPVRWFDVPEPDPVNPGNASPTRPFAQAFNQGGAKFNRLEGCWFDAGHIFFVSTSGGDAKNGDVTDGFAEGYGQVWRYTPGRGDDDDDGELELIFESPGVDVLDSPDNLTVTPRGGLILCEDDAGGADGDAHPLAPGITDVNRLIGISRDGEGFELAVNRLSDSELAGACFSPSGATLFVNIFGNGTPGSGMTLAITEPWGARPL